MAQQLTRKNILAVVKETTEGVLVYPTSATDYVPIQSDLSITPEFEELTNEELRANIGRTKSILGFENPSGSVSIYLKGSGVAGTAPDEGPLLEAAFGTENIAAAELDVISATAGTAAAKATVTVDTGEGATYAVGEALLIQGATAYEIRNIESIAGDVLTLGQNLANAPVATDLLGRAVHYDPANDSHPSLSLHHYVGNGGAIQAVAGARVTEFSYSAEAGALINASYSVEGLKYLYNPLEITATSNALDFTDDGGAKSITDLSTQSFKDPHEAAQALEDALNAASVDVWTVVYSDALGTFTVGSDGTTPAIDWLSTSDTLGAVYGFTADDSAGNDYVSDAAIALSSPQTPTFASVDPSVGKNSEVIFGDFDDITCVDAQSVSVTVATPKTNVDSLCAESGRSGSIINDREVTVEVVAYLDQYEADRFHKFHTNQEIVFTHNFGPKSAGNWVKNKVMNFHLPRATITSFELADADGIVQMNLSLRAFVGSAGEDEVHLNFL